MSTTIESIALEHCRIWDERLALKKRRRALTCEYEDDGEGVHARTSACFRGGQVRYDSAQNEVEGEWCEPCQQSRTLTAEIQKLTRKVVGTRTRMLNAARRTP